MPHCCIAASKPAGDLPRAGLRDGVSVSEEHGWDPGLQEWVSDRKPHRASGATRTGQAPLVVS